MHPVYLIYRLSYFSTDTLALTISSLINSFIFLVSWKGCRFALRTNSAVSWRMNEWSNAFCSPQALAHYAGNRNSIEHGLSLLNVYSLSINCFASARPHLTACSSSVALVLKRLALWVLLSENISTTSLSGVWPCIIWEMVPFSSIIMPKLARVKTSSWFFELNFSLIFYFLSYSFLLPVSTIWFNNDKMISILLYFLHNPNLCRRSIEHSPHFIFLYYWLFVFFPSIA